MKKSFLIVFGILLIIAVGLLLLPVENNTEQDELWKNAIYTEDTTLGNGENYFLLVVNAADKAVSFTVMTDKTTVGEALKDVKLIDGEEGPYGIYIKKVNGILADYDIDKSYWAFSKDGVSLSTGADDTVFKNGEKFELVYTK